MRSRFNLDLKLEAVACDEIVSLWKFSSFNLVSAEKRVSSEKLISINDKQTIIIKYMDLKVLFIFDAISLAKKISKKNYLLQPIDSNGLTTEEVIFFKCAPIRFKYLA